MKFEFSPNSLATISTDILIVFAMQQTDKKKSGFIPFKGFTELDVHLKGKLHEICTKESFSGKRKEVLSFYPDSTVLATKIMVVGLGNPKEFVADDLRRVMGVLGKKLHYSADSISLMLPTDDIVGLDGEIASKMIAEGVQLGTYEFGKYKEQQKKDHVLELVIFSQIDKKVQTKVRAACTRATLYTQATRIARDLVNEQPSIATPTFLATLAKDIAKSSPLLSCKVLDKEHAEKLGMEAFLGIARGADTPPKFIVLEYKPAGGKAKKKLALIGKGITFDSGGINVKPGDHMQDMKMDMAGGAAVLGVFSVIAQIKPSFPVLGIIAATPNMISGKSIVPGDIVRAMNGKTIEVLNTDAEGRVTMADSLSYAVKEGATEMIDLATLTGACVVALGEEIAGIFPNNQDLCTRLKAAAFTVGEKVWEMPMDKDYREQNKSDVADISNIGKSRYGGAITAALFLEQFVGDTAFVHMDIAGPAFSNRGNDISPKGGTGFGVRTLLNLIMEGGQTK